MNLMKTGLAALAASITLASAPAVAQESVKAEAREATYHVLRYVKFRPGTKGRAIQIFRDYIHKADEIAGTNTDQLALVFMTGDWDAVIATSIGPNLDRLELSSDPEQAKWGAALAQVAGGPEQAMAVMEELRGYIVKESWQHAYSIE